MSSSWLLKLAFKCLHHFAWPLVALVYPMCASVRAIETDSYAETKDLISYWIFLSLIYLFEYAFMSLLLWFHLWLYIKLMVIFYLIIPDFERASYVYNKLILTMKPHIVTWRLNDYWTKCFVEKDNFLMHAERYMKENGTDALEKLIANKHTMCSPDAEVRNEIIATDDKDILMTNDERHETENKDIRNLEAIEKKEIPATNQDIPVIPEIEPSQNPSSVTVETKGTAESDRAGGEFPKGSTSTQKEMQKKWTCALCLVTTTSKKDLNSHLTGRKHRDTIEALSIAKKQPTLKKQKDAEGTNEIIATDNKEILKTNGERLGTENKDINDLEAIENKEFPSTEKRTYANIVASQTASSAIIETKGTSESVTACGEVPQSSSQKAVQKEWTCALCLVTVTCEKTLISHLRGRRHRETIEALKAKKQPTLQKNLSEHIKMINSKVICKVCNIMLPSEDYVASHIKGWKHLSNIKS